MRFLILLIAFNLSSFAQQDSSVLYKKVIGVYKNGWHSKFGNVVTLHLKKDRSFVRKTTTCENLDPYGGDNEKYDRPFGPEESSGKWSLKKDTLILNYFNSKKILQTATKPDRFIYKNNELIPDSLTKINLPIGCTRFGFVVKSSDIKLIKEKKYSIKKGK